MRPEKSGLRHLALLTLLCTLGACGRKTAPPASPNSPDRPDAGATAAATSSSPAPPDAAPTPPPLPKVPVSTAPPPKEIWNEFSGEKAFAEVKKQVEIGARPSGSAEIEKARQHITRTLESHGWEVERQEFTDETPRGSMKFVNLIGRFAADGSRPVPRTSQRAIVCSHYDTKRFSTIRFVGANDAGSSTGALLELARVLALDPVLAAKIELVFFDGEEAVVQFTDTDGLYGSRHYARGLRESGRASQFQFGILWDMIGDSDLTITLSPDSPPEPTKSILASAEALGLRQHFSYYDRSIWDDHVPLNQIKIPTVNLIDFDYLYWHTADDKLERLSPESLQKIGAITLHHLQKTLRR